MLHTINKSPFEKNSIDSCLRLASAGSAILLIEDAVYAALEGTAFADKLGAVTEKYKLYVLGPDLRARGMDSEAVINGIEIVDYSGFVDLAVEHAPVQSWL
jgi:tRNA 2-thiouridine synthesizing protein B